MRRRRNYFSSARVKEPRSIPASIFFPVEGGWLLALSVLLIAATIWLVRRHAA